MTDLDVFPSPEPTRRASTPSRTTLLADGQEWGLALPTPRYRPEVVKGVDELGRPTETIRLLARVGYPEPIDRLVDELRSACRGGVDSASDARRFEVLMTLAVALLRRSHDLTLAEAALLLDLDADGLSRVVDAVLATLAGSPSDSSPGSVSPPGGGNA